MREGLTELLGRMGVDDRLVDSLTSVSWHAHREAERLDDLSMVPELLARYRPQLKSGARGDLIFVLAKIGQNTQHPSCVEALLAILPQETLMYNLDTLLTGLGEIEKPPERDLAPIFALLADKRWLVRHAALCALARSHSPDAEPRVLAHLAATDDKYDQTYAQRTLASIGTAAALPLLRENAKSRKPDVRMSARYAIEKIGARTSLVLTSPNNNIL